MKITAGTVARTVCLCLALINQLLAIFGKNVIPFAEDDVYQAVSIIFTLASSVAAWWKNNSFTQAACLADKILCSEKECKSKNAKK